MAAGGPGLWHEGGAGSGPAEGARSQRRRRRGGEDVGRLPASRGQSGETGSVWVWVGVCVWVGVGGCVWVDVGGWVWVGVGGWVGVCLCACVGVCGCVRG